MKHGNFQHNESRLNQAKAAILVNLAVIILCLVVVILDPGTPTIDEVVANAPRAVYRAMTALLHTIGVFITRLAAGIFFLQWLLTALNNARILRPEQKLPSNKFSLWCWFIPVFNLVAPYVVLSQLSAATYTEQPRSLSRNVKIWFLAYFLQSPPVNWLVLKSWWYTIDYGSQFIAAYFLFRVMNQVTIAQEREFAATESNPVAAIAANAQTVEDSGAVIRTDLQTLVAEPTPSRIEP